MKNSRQIRMTYRDQLQSWEWRQFSLEQIEKANKECWCCGSEESLQVHHLVYRRGAMAWEYADNEVRVLCRDCHEAIHNVAELIWVELLRFQPHELEIVLKRLLKARPKQDENGLGLSEILGDLEHRISGADVSK